MWKLAMVLFLGWVYIFAALLFAMWIGASIWH